MKRFLYSLAITVAAISAVIADPVECLKISLTNIGTNSTLFTSTNSATPSLPYGAMLEGIYVDLGGAANPTGVLAFTQRGETETGPAITLLSVTTSADAYYPVRIKTCDTSGATLAGTNGMTRLPLFHSPIRLVAYDTDVTNVNVDAYIYYSR